MRLRLTRNQRLLLTAGVALLIYFVGLGAPALWEPDEGRYAEIPREMVISGDFVTPHNDGVRYFEKPPLIYWAGAAAIKLLGTTEFAVRAQAALASVGSVVITQLIAEAIAGEAVGFLAAVVLGLSPLFFVFARFASPDPALAFFLTAALGSFYCAARGDFRTGASRQWMLLASASLGLGTLAKGPVALLLGGGIALAWMMMEGRAREVLALRWLECAGIYLATVAPWFVLVSARNPGFLHFFFVHEHWQRYLENTEHGWGPWFFVPIVLFGTWPFFYFVPLGARSLWMRNSATPQRDRSDVRFLLLWFMVIFIFFSIPHSKLGEYMLPGIPPLAILAAIGLRAVPMADPNKARRVARSFALINSLPLVLIAAEIALWRSGVWSLPRSVPGLSVDGSLIRDAAMLALGLAIPSILWSIAQWFSYRGFGLDRVCLFTAALVSVVLIKVRIDMPGVSYRSLARAITPRLQSGCALISYHHFVQSLPFYTGSHELLAGYRGELAPFADSPDAQAMLIPTDARLAALWSEPGCVIVIANRSDLDRLKALLVPPPVILACEGKKFALTNHAATADDPQAASGCLEKLEKR